MIRQVSLVGLFVAAASALATGCTDPTYHYADDVKSKFTADETTPSIEAGLGCEGAHPEKESKEDQEAREKQVPKSAQGKAWLAGACRIAADFDAAEPFTAWPAGASDVWVGRRICRAQINASLAEKLGDDSYAEVARIDFAKGDGKALWLTGPEIDKGRLTGFSAVFLEEAVKIDDARSAMVDGFIETAKSGAKVDFERLREGEKPEDTKKYKDDLALVRKHLEPGQTVKSEGKSVLAYPVTGNPGDPSAVHYLRQAGDRLLVVTPLPGASPPSPCVAELWRQK